MAAMLLSLSVSQGGCLRVLPAGGLPRLERAFAASPGMGMLDLLRFGVPAGSAPALSWLAERTREVMVRYLLALRRGALPQEAAEICVPAPQEAVRWLEAMPPVEGAAPSVSDVRGWFASLPGALAELCRRECCSPELWLSRLGEGWQQLGLLCFHLAENAGDDAPSHPFAFLATFVHKVGADGKPRHAPLGMAAQLCANDREGLLTLLRPLRCLAQQGGFWRELIESRAVYRPCAWSPREAYAFLEALPAAESLGVEVHMVNLWKSRPPKAQLEVQLEVMPDGSAAGAKPDGAPSINVNALLHFVPQVALGDRFLTEEELAELLALGDGLVRFRGEWVRLDRTRLQGLLDCWRSASRMAAGGIPLLTGLRYLLGNRREALPDLPPAEEGVRLSAGARLSLALSRLRFGDAEPDLPPELARLLRPYQLDGVRFLLNVTEPGFGACLADDMGLGKTLQVTAWLLHLKRAGALSQGAALVVAPASLLRNWQEELARFAPQLRVLTLHPYALNAADRELLRADPARLLRRGDVALTTYGMVSRLELLSGASLPALVLDEAQAIKNADSARARAVRRLRAPRRAALTGTPVENHLGELRSLFEFLNPGLLGSETEFRAMLREMGTDYTPLRRLVRPFMLRRLKSDPALLPELPPKTEQPAYCFLTQEQAALYAHEVQRLQAVIQEPDPSVRLRLLLPVLGCLKQICNHPAQYLGEQFYDPARSGKMQRLGKLAEQVAASGACCLVFTQYRRMMEPLHDFLAGIFGGPGLCLHGGTPIEERQELVRRFQHAGGPRFFVLSLKAAGTGLTLTRASHVIHFDRWWNPAVENQASDRAYRIGQRLPVVVHPMICLGTIESNIHRMLARKSAMADALLAGGLEKLLLHMSPAELMELVQPGAEVSAAL